MEATHSATYALHGGPQPVMLPAPLSGVTRAGKGKSLPVWVRVPTDDGGETVKVGFALAWTRDVVEVQVLWPVAYYQAATEFWVTADRVRRRTIEPQWLGRDR